MVRHVTLFCTTGAISLYKIGPLHLLVLLRSNVGDGRHLVSSAIRACLGLHPPVAGQEDTCMANTRQPCQHKSPAQVSRLSMLCLVEQLRHEVAGIAKMT